MLRQRLRPTLARSRLPPFRLRHAMKSSDRANQIRDTSGRTSECQTHARKESLRLEAQSPFGGGELLPGPQWHVKHIDMSVRRNNVPLNPGNRQRNLVVC